MFLETVSPGIIWAIFGIILFLLELFMPGLVIFFFGFGGLITALTSALGITGSLSSQLIVFVVTSVATLLIFRNLLKRKFMERVDDDKTDNYNIQIGKIVSVIELIEPNEIGGKVRYQGSPWSAESTERIGPGESVKITGFRNLTLIVEKINKDIN